eukprot:1169501_1
MKSLLLIIVAVVVILATTRARQINPIKHHKRRHLKELTRKDHQEMLVPIFNEDINGYWHHVRVDDERDNYFEFQFEATLHPNTHVLTLNDEGHRENITDIVCGDDHMKVYPVDVDYYHEHIRSQLDLKKEVFIPDSCDKQSTKIRRVHSVQKADGGLLLTSSTADHLDMFDDYFIEFKSNAPVHFHHDTDDHGVTNRRRLSDECDATLVEHPELDFAFELAETAANFVHKIKQAIKIFKVMRTLLESFIGVLESIFQGEQDHTWNDEPLGDPMECHREMPSLDMGDGQCENCYFDFNFGVHLMMKKGTKPLEWKFLLKSGVEAGISVSSMYIGLGVEAHTKPLRPTKPFKIVEGIHVLGLDLDVRLMPSVSFAASLETEATIDFTFLSTDGNLELGLQNPKRKGLFQPPRVIKKVPHKITSSDLTIETESIDEMVSASLKLSTRIVFALTFVKMFEIDFIVEPHVDITIYDRDPSDPKDCVLYWSSKAYAAWYIQPRMVWPILVIIPDNLQHHDVEKPKNQDIDQNIYYCLTKKDHTYHTKDSSRSRRRSLLPSNVPELASFNYLTDFKAISIDSGSRYGIRSSWGVPHTTWWANVTSVPELCADNYGSKCAGFPVPPEGNLALEYVSEHNLLGIYHTSFDVPVDPNAPWFDVWYTNRTHVEFSCITALNFTQTSRYLSDANLYEYTVDIIDWWCNQIGTNHSLNISNEEWQCMISLPETMDVVALDVSFDSIVLFDGGTWCRVFPLTLRDGYSIDSHHFNFSFVSPLWYGSFHCDAGGAMQIAFRFHEINEDGTVGCVLEFDGTKTNYFEGKVDFDAMTMVLNDTYDYVNDQSSDGVVQFIGVLTVLDDGTILYSGSVKWSGCTGFVIVGHTSIVNHNISTASNATNTTDIGIYNMSTTDVEDDDSDDLVDDFHVFAKEYALHSLITSIFLLILVFVLSICLLCRGRKKHQKDMDGETAHAL